MYDTCKCPCVPGTQDGCRPTKRIQCITTLTILTQGQITEGTSDNINCASFGNNDTSNKCFINFIVILTLLIARNSHFEILHWVKSSVLSQAAMIFQWIKPGGPPGLKCLGRTLHIVLPLPWIKLILNRPFYRYGGHFGFHCFRYLLWDAQGANTY